MRKLFILLPFIMITSLFASRENYTVLKEKVKYYEFNIKRDKIFIMCTDNTLYIYDTKTATLKQILENEELSPDLDYLYKTSTPMFYSDKNILYIAGKRYIYKIKNEKLEKIPIINEEKKYDSDNVSLEGIRANGKKYKKFLDRLRKKIRDFSGKSISGLFDNIFILEYKDGKHEALFVKTVKKLEKKYVDKVQMHLDEKNIFRKVDSSYSRKNHKGNQTINSFENSKVSILEDAYFCEFFPHLFNMMRLNPVKCWYEMKISLKNNTVKLNDRTRKYRGIYTGGWNGNLYTRLPASKFITDSTGNVYVLFPSGGHSNLIKVNHGTN